MVPLMLRARGAEHFVSDVQGRVSGFRASQVRETGRVAETGCQAGCGEVFEGGSWR